MRKKTFLAVAVMLLASGNTWAATKSVESDSIRVYNLKEVEVVATRADEKTPIAFTNVSAEELNRINKGKDMPSLLSGNPSVITTSDAGAGIGYTSLRVRGTDATRINVTSNGVPMNDGESHGLFWVNMPDIVSSLKDIQIQRGAGTSTNGAGAFGASINMQTQAFSPRQSAEVSASYGSFNTHKETLKVSSGVFNEHWSVDARISNIGTDGYIDRASVNLNSFYLQGGYFDDNTSLKFVTFGGKEKTYHAWNYASKAEMFENGRTYNSCGEYYDEEGNRHYYDDQTDNYQQYNFQLILNQRLSSKFKLNVTGHYTKGIGYYEEYKSGRKVKEYGFDPEELGTKESDLVRQKKLNNDFGGAIFSLDYNHKRVKATLGGSVNYYKGDHYGNVKWVKTLGLLPSTHEYYNNYGEKLDANIYARATVDLFANVNAFADLQFRHINYKIKGLNDNYDFNIGEMQQLNVDDDFNFFNPKAGLNWRFCDKNRLFFSFAIAQKEPTRNNYTDGLFTEYPRSEKLYDYELGYNYSYGPLSLGVNLYYMWYKDQLVLSGALNEIGEAVAINVPESYRMGIELQAAWQPVQWFKWSANATFSKNRIEHYTEIINDDNYVGDPIKNYYEDTPIAFSPSTIFNNSFLFEKSGFEALFETQYVSRQYMSNARHEEHILDAYCVSNLHLAYNFKLPKIKNVRVGLSIYNILNEEYENNGYAGSGYYNDGKKNVVYHYAGYAAQAGTNFLGNVTISF